MKFLLFLAFLMTSSLVVAAPTAKNLTAKRDHSKLSGTTAGAPTYSVQSNISGWEICADAKNTGTVTLGGGSGTDVVLSKGDCYTCPSCSAYSLTQATVQASVAGLGYNVYQYVLAAPTKNYPQVLSITALDCTNNTVATANPSACQINGQGGNKCIFANSHYPNTSCPSALCPAGQSWNGTACVAITFIDCTNSTVASAHPNDCTFTGQGGPQCYTQSRAAANNCPTPAYAKCQLVLSQPAAHWDVVSMTCATGY